MMDDELFIRNDGWSVTECFLRHVYMTIYLYRDLSSNQLSGSIPKEIESLTSLGVLLVNGG